MKILAQSRTLVADEAAYTEDLLRAEAKYVWSLQQSGVVREIYFTAGEEAVVILECPSAAAARRVLARFPLVRAKLIAFACDELRAYPGYARLFAKKQNPDGVPLRIGRS